MLSRPRPRPVALHPAPPCIPSAPRLGASLPRMSPLRSSQHSQSYKLPFPVLQRRLGGPRRGSHELKVTQVTRGNSGIQTRPDSRGGAPTRRVSCPSCLPRCPQSPGLSATTARVAGRRGCNSNNSNSSSSHSLSCYHGPGISRPGSESSEQLCEGGADTISTLRQ